MMRAGLIVLAVLLLVTVPLKGEDLRDTRYTVSSTKCASMYDSHIEGPCSASWAIIPALVATDEACVRGIVSSATPNANPKRFSYKYIMECCAACWVGFDDPCQGGSFSEAMKFIVESGTVVGGSDLYPTMGVNNCKSYKWKECYNDPDVGSVTYSTVNGGIAQTQQAVCTDDLLSTTGKIDTMCPKNCDPPSGQTTGAAIFGATGQIGEKMQLSGSYSQVAFNTDYEADMVAESGSGTTGRILITDIVVFEDLLTYKKVGTDFPTYSHQWGRAIGTVIVAIYGWNADYWIVRFPWGNRFGDNGYVRIQKGVNMCGIENQNTAWRYNP